MRAALSAQARQKAGSRILRRETGLVSKVLLYGVLLAFAVMTLFPLAWLVISSFKTTQAFQLDPLGLPKRWYVANYPQA